MKKITNLFIFFLICYVGMCAMLFFTQRSLLYHPVKNSTPPTGWIALQKNNYILGIENKIQSNKTIVIFHGNSQNASSKTHYEKMFPNTKIIINEYPTFGLNNKNILNEITIREQAHELMTYVTENYNPKNTLLIGESLGTGVASLMAKEFDIPQIVLITPYTSLKEVAQFRYWFAPAKYLLKDNFDNIANLTDYKGKVLIVMAQNDNVINVKFAQTLFDTLKSTKQSILVENAGHSTWRNFLTTPQKEMLSFFIKNNT